MPSEPYPSEPKSYTCTREDGSTFTVTLNGDTLTQDPYGDEFFWDEEEERWETGGEKHVLRFYPEDPPNDPTFVEIDLNQTPYFTARGTWT